MDALLHDTLPGGTVRCRLCAHQCRINKGKRGICKVRENQAGKLKTLVYEKLIAANADPIEKKPLYHFHPGSLSFSIATVGCNFTCRFCQNADIARPRAIRDGHIPGDPVSPERIVSTAVRTGCRSIAYTYTEPTVFFEYALATAKLAKGSGLANVFVTNGYMSAETLGKVSPYLDAANVDLKSFSDDFYRELCGARLEPVLETLKRMVAGGVFVEVTTLIVPGKNDDPAELGDIAEFIRNELGPDTPWHVSRFHPTHRMTDRGPTPPETVVRAREIGMEKGLRYVYTGNLRDPAGETTFCPSCNTPVIERNGFSIREYRMENGKCLSCGNDIYGIGL